MIMYGMRLCELHAIQFLFNKNIDIMAKKQFYKVADDDGVVIYDESDDFDPVEDEVSDNGLMTNEEIFTDEYMDEYARKMDAKIARMKRNDWITSIGVILFVIALIVGFSTLIWHIKT